MKKILCAIGILLLTACGSAHTSNSTNVDSSTPIGSLAVNFSQATDSSGKTLSSIASGKNFRVVVRNQTLRVNGEVFSLIQDAVPGAAMTFALPIATGYTVEALAYNNDAATGLNSVLLYATTSDVKVSASGTSNVFLNLYPISASLILPTSVIQGGRYTAQANYSTAAGRLVTPLQTSWYLIPPKTTSFAPFVNHTSTTNFLASSHIYLAPITGGVATNLYFQAVFTIKPALVAPGENQKMWVYNSPEYAVPVTAPGNLSLTAPNF